jgi:hypothetical protein
MGFEKKENCFWKIIGKRVIITIMDVLIEGRKG